MLTDRELEEAVWAACPKMKEWTDEHCSADRSKRPHKCKKCPSKSIDPVYGEVHVMCFEIAREVVEPALKAVAAEQTRVNLDIISKLP